MNEKTMVLGATPDTGKYAYKASVKLIEKGHSIVNIGLGSGEAGGVPIEKPGIIYPDIDTVTIYVAPQNQRSLYDYLLNIKPRRIIFNPGTENPELARLAHEQGIRIIHACSLVLLSTAAY